MCNEFSLVWIHIKQSPNWIPTACSIICVLQRFGGRCCHHLQGEWTSCGIWIQNMEAACSSIIRVTKQNHYTTQCKTHTIPPNLTHQAMCFVQYSLTGLTVTFQSVVTIQNHPLWHEVFPYFCYSFSFSASNFHHQLHCNSVNLNVINFSTLWILSLSCVGWLHYFLVPIKNLNLSNSYAITLMQNLFISELQQLEYTCTLSHFHKFLSCKFLCCITSFPIPYLLLIF